MAALDSVVRRVDTWIQSSSLITPHLHHDDVEPIVDTMVNVQIYSDGDDCVKLFAYCCVLLPDALEGLCRTHGTTLVGLNSLAFISCVIKPWLIALMKHESNPAFAHRIELSTLLRCAIKYHRYDTFEKYYPHDEAIMCKDTLADVLVLFNNQRAFDYIVSKPHLNDTGRGFDIVL